MSTAAKQFVESALMFSTEEREEIIAELIRSLDGPQPTPKQQEKIDSAWVDLAERRDHAIDAGQDEAVDGEAIMAKLERGECP